jgi:mRNA interferase RelE/StbE
MYSILISPSALKELQRLQKPDVKKIGKIINGLALDPRPVGVKKLKGGSEELYRIRSGDYRVIYSIEDEIKVVDIRKIGHRKDIYKLL